MKRFTALLLLGLVAALLVACGPQEAEPTLVVTTNTPDQGVVKDGEESADDGEDTGDAAAADEGEMGEPTPFPTPPPPPTLDGFKEAKPELLELLPEYDEADVIETDSGLRYVILEEGAGESPQTCDVVDAHYTGYLIDGTVFDSSIDRDQTFQFPLGQGNVIRGWDEGFALLKPGAKAILMIPPALGYGTTDRGTIPPNSTLYFDVELVDVITNRPTEVADADYVELDGGVKYATLAEGTTPIADTEVMVLEFTLWDANGCVLSSTAQGNGNIAFDRGGDRMFGAMITSTTDIKLGESRQMLWPQDAMINSGLQPISYTIEVTAVNALDAPPATFDTTVTDADYTEVLTTGVKYVVLEAGTGDDVLVLDTIDVIYHIWTPDGELLTSTIYSGEAGGVPYLYGQNSLPGFDEGLEGTKIGEKRQVVLPASLVPPDPTGVPPTDLIMQIEVLGKQSTIAPSE